MVAKAADKPAVGILVIAHGELARGLISAAEEILGPQAGLGGLRLDPGDGEPRLRLLDAMAGLDEGAGVLALVDLFGGTPSNIALALGPEHALEVVTGANLPMLIRVLTQRQRLALGELARTAADYGRQQILLPNQLLPTGSGP